MPWPTSFWFVKLQWKFYRAEIRGLNRWTRFTDYLKKKRQSQNLENWFKNGLICIVPPHDVFFKILKTDIFDEISDSVTEINICLIYKRSSIYGLGLELWIRIRLLISIYYSQDLTRLQCTTDKKTANYSGRNIWLNISTFIVIFTVVLHSECYVILLWGSNISKLSGLWRFE